MKKSLILGVSLFTLGLPLLGQELVDGTSLHSNVRPEVKSHNKVWYFLEAAEIASRSLDAWSTHRFENDPCNCLHEANPIAPDTKKLAPVILWQAGAAALVIGGERVLRHYHHPKLAAALLTLDITYEGYTVGRNVRILDNVHQNPAYTRNK